MRASGAGSDEDGPGAVTVPVTYESQEPNGLAAMLGGIIEGNLRTHPERERLVTEGKPATFSISAPDVDVAVSIRFSPGGVQVRNGVVGRPDVRIESDSETLMGLSTAPLRFGLPDATKKEGREVVGKMLSRALKVRGAVAHSGKLARLNKMLSVS
jgi:hypothetical protein